MNLTDWLSRGWVVHHTTTPEEVAELLAIADRDLAACEASGVGVDWRLNIAYNSALQSATAALAAAGYRATRIGHHYRVIESLAHTIGAEPPLVTELHHFRNMRHNAAYERVGAVSQQEADGMVVLAKQLRQDVDDWLKAARPDLLP